MLSKKNLDLFTDFFFTTTYHIPRVFKSLLVFCLHIFSSLPVVGLSDNFHFYLQVSFQMTFLFSLLIWQFFLSHCRIFSSIHHYSFTHPTARISIDHLLAFFFWVFLFFSLSLWSAYFHFFLVCLFPFCSLNQFPPSLFYSTPNHLLVFCYPDYIDSLAIGLFFLISPTVTLPTLSCILFVLPLLVFFCPFMHWNRKTDTGNLRFFAEVDTCWLDTFLSFQFSLSSFLSYFFFPATQNYHMWHMDKLASLVKYVCGCIIDTTIDKQQCILRRRDVVMFIVYLQIYCLFRTNALVEKMLSAVDEKFLHWTKNRDDKVKHLSVK